MGARRAIVYDEDDRETLVAEICERLLKGEPLAAICRDPMMPGATKVWAWCQEYPAVRDAITRAREHGGHAIAVRAMQTARGFGPDRGGDSTGDIQRDKLIVDTDLRLLSKWFPKAYGEAMQLRHADADGQKLDTAPLVARLQELMTKAPGAQELLPPAPGDQDD